MINYFGSLAPTSQLLRLACLLFIVYQTLYELRRSAKIRRLGSRAPIRRKCLPYGLDMGYTAITYARKNKTLEMWTKLFERWSPGHWTVEAGVGERMIFTAEPENVKAILATQFKEFGKGEEFHRNWFPFLGNGIFATDGQLWHNSRQLIRPQFVKDRLSDLHIFEQHVQILIKKLGETPETDVLDMLFRYTLDAATHFLLGKSVESLNKDKVPFAYAFYNVQRVQSIVSKLGTLTWLVPRRQLGFYESLKTLNEFVNVFIEKALALSPDQLEGKRNPKEVYTFLHAIAAYTRDRTTLRDQLVSVLLASRDTTACTLTWTIYELSIQPHITTKLRQEIIERVGLNQAPTYEDLKNMKYLSHVMNETMRLYPAVPYNTRVALQDTTIPTGGGPDGRQPIGILKGDHVAYSALVVHRRADLYPSVDSGFPAADQFVPERWDAWTPKSWTYIPFNGGPRVCIGQQFALAEMGYTLVRLLQKFETLENKMGGELPGLRADVLLQPGKRVTVAFR